MTTIALEVPDELAVEVKQCEERLWEVILPGILQPKTQEAWTLYHPGPGSLARAAELAGVSSQGVIRPGRQSRWSIRMAQAGLA